MYPPFLHPMESEHRDRLGEGCSPKGSGIDLINTIKRELPNTEFIAEDLGFLTKEVMELQKESGFPGMKILQFAFDNRESGNYMPETYTSNTVCCTGIHDNETLVQWKSEVSR